MKPPSKTIHIFLLFALLTAFITACGPPKTISKSMTEDEFNQTAFMCRNHGLIADFQPGKIVCTGDVDGQAAVVDITAEIVEGNIRFQIVKATADGGDLSPDKFAELNADMAVEAIEPEENYAVTSVVITDSEMTITMERK